MNERLGRGLARLAEIGGSINARTGLDSARRELVILGVLIALGGTGPPTVDGDTAVLTAVFHAAHILVSTLGSPRWTLGGTYHFDLIRSGGGWRISGVRQTPTWTEGNKDILTLASGGRRPAAV
jgi:hypothetical protein